MPDRLLARSAVLVPALRSALIVALSLSLNKSQARLAAIRCEPSTPGICAYEPFVHGRCIS